MFAVTGYATAFCESVAAVTHIVLLEDATGQVVVTAIIPVPGCRHAQGRGADSVSTCVLGCTIATFCPARVT